MRFKLETKNMYVELWFYKSELHMDIERRFTSMVTDLHSYLPMILYKYILIIKGNMYEI